MYIDRKKRVLILLGTITLLVFYFPFKNYLLERELTRDTLSILQNWQSNNIPGNYVYWKEPMNCPPIYGLNSYKIIKTVSSQKGDFPAYEFYLQLDFPAENLLPSGKTWVLEYHKFPRLGWLVVDFKQIN